MKSNIQIIALVFLIPLVTFAKIQSMKLDDGNTYFCTWEHVEGKSSSYPYMVEVAGNSCNGDSTNTKRCMGVGRCWRETQTKIYFSYQIAFCGLPPTLSGNCADWSFVDCAEDSKTPDRFFNKEQQRQFSESLKAHADPSERAAVHFTSK